MSAVVLLVVVAVVALLVAAGIWLRRKSEQRAEEERRWEEARQAERELEQTLEAGKRAVRAVVGTAARVRDQGLRGVFLDSIESLAGWAEDERPDLRRMAARDGTVTIVFSDIEDSTAINEELGDKAWVRVLGAHDSIVRARVSDHDGHIVKSRGDGFMIVFASPEEALRCAIEIQRALAGGNRRLRRAGIRVRIGIHLGQAVAKHGDLYGRNVAYAARVAGEAKGGEILVSAPVGEAAGGDDGISFTAPREVELKGLSGEHRVLAVAWEDD
jgi:adenylate cyclase